MTVNKSTCEVYDVSQNGEYATMALRAWRTTTPGGRVQHAGEVLIHSSFGSFCYTWPNVAVPFKQFLRDISYESFMRKTLGLSSRVYCPGKTGEQFTRLLESLVAGSSITRQQADTVLLAYSADLPRSHQAYIETIDALADSDEMRNLFAQEQIDEVFGEARMLKGMKENPQAVGFWAQLWPELVATLRAEVDQPDLGRVSDSVERHAA